MSIPFMSDVSLKSINDNTFYIRTQGEFDKVINVMCTALAPQPYTHIVIYPNSDNSDGEYYAPGSDPEDNNMYQTINFKPKTHCLIEGIGKPIIRVRGMTTTTITGTISLKGLDIQIQPYEEGDPTTILENFSKIEDCDISINLGGYLYGSTTAGLFTKCNNISNITITSNRSLLGFIMFYQCNGLSNIKEALTTPPPSYQRYVECTGVETSCPGVVIYSRNARNLTPGQGRSSTLSGQHCINYATHQVEVEFTLKNIEMDSTTTVISLTDLRNRSDFPHMPYNLVLYPNDKVVGYWTLVSGGTPTVEDIKCNSNNLIVSSSSIPGTSANVFKFVLSFA